MKKKLFKFKIYVAGDTAASNRAIGNIKKIAEKNKDFATIKIVIIDIFQEPEQAELARIIATPTVVRVSPKPIIKLIGDLSQQSYAMEELGLA